MDLLMINCIFVHFELYMYRYILRHLVTGQTHCGS